MSQSPNWFKSAIRQEAEEIRVGPVGKQLAVRHWASTNPEKENGPAIILVHGFLAHARWFDFIAPSLRELGPVYAFDMPGMGDSDHFDAYEIADYIDCFDVLIRELELEKPFIVSHSLGSLMAMNYAYAKPENLSGLVITDSPFRLESKEPDTPQSMRLKHYDSKETIVSRFRLLPFQECQKPFVFEYVAQNSVKEAPEGWCWKFDTNRQTGTEDMYMLWETSFARFEQLKVPNAFIYGENSKLCTPEWVEKAKERMNPDYKFVEIKNAEHHLLLDQPLDFIAEVQKLIEGWS